MKTVVVRNIDRADAAAVKRLGALGNMREPLAKAELTYLDKPESE